MAGANVVNGAFAIAKALQTQGIKYAFGVVGIPVIEVATAMQQVGIKFIGMRNEQAASYAAGAIGYLSKMPGICLVVSGPGLIHALGGMANAQVNGWPLVVVGGSCDRDQEGFGGFQEFPQLEASRLYSKYTCRPSCASLIPFHVEKSIRYSTYGRPGTCYIDLPGDIINQELPASDVTYAPKCPSPPLTEAPPHLISSLVDVLIQAKRPLVVIGKGAAYSAAEECIHDLISRYNLPFLPTPMGKGVVSDKDSRCVAPARSKALSQADVILLLGARLNWILHFGRPPRFSPDVKILQVDINMEELHNSIQASVGITGDVCSVVKQILSELRSRSWSVPKTSDWWMALQQKRSDNDRAVKEMCADKSTPLNYYAAYSVVQSLLPEDAIIINEGANTMDIGRTMLPNTLPRHRIDAGTFGTMGMGLGSAIAAAVWCGDHAPQKRVICIQGDSAFGFSGLEMETANRYKLPIIVIVFNNNGIYAGLDEESWKMLEEEPDQMAVSVPPTCLLPSAHYERMCDVFGGKGFFVKTAEELQSALKEALSITHMPSIINVLIAPSAQRKPQDFPWLTRSKM